MKAELKRKLVVALVAPAIGFSAAGMAASDRSATGTTNQGSAATQRGDKPMRTASAQDVRASKLIGMKVRNAQGENLGKIDDLIVDVNNERVAYAVLASGGVLGLGGKLFAYPVSLFRQEATERDQLVLNVEKERLKNAPGFEKKNWPEWGQDQDRYRSEVDRYFGPTVTAKSLPNERLVRASTLIGKDIDDREGRDAGEIKDLVVNLGSAKVNYAVLDLSGDWGAEDRLLPASLRALSFPAERDKDLVINLAKNQVDMSRGIEEGRWNDVDINDPAFKRNINTSLRTAATASAGAGAAGRPGEEPADSRMRQQQQPERHRQQQPAD